MDFEKVIKTSLNQLDSQQVRSAVIGGFALSALGVPRMATDLDFMVHQFRIIPRVGLRE
jgi:hypothetical protein